MINYIVRRLLLFIPTLILISLLGFVISISSPGDPVERLVNTAGGNEGIGSGSGSSEALKQEVREDLGLDQPIFYFKIATAAEPDTLYRIPDKGHRKTLKAFSRQYGNWRLIASYYKRVKRTLKAQRQLQVGPDKVSGYSGNEIKDLLTKSKFELISLLDENQDKTITKKLEKLKNLYSRHNFLNPLHSEIKAVKEAYLKMISNPTFWKAYMPSFHWYGLKNQYHNWISGILLEGDFGKSYRDQQPVMDRIKKRFFWSFSLAILSVFFAYLVSIPIGIYAAYKRNSFFDRASGTTLFALISLPNFFIGTILLFLFANPDIFNWFPEAGVMDPTTFQEEWSLLKKIQHFAPYLVLPLITYTYSSFAFLSRQMRVGMLDIINQDYIKTARAKGLNEKTVILKHALRNGLLPIITLFANIFPMILGGSVIVETIFSIPGMGLEIYQSILNSDYPMIVAIFTLMGFLTILGYLVADILYAIVDPRISYQ